MAGIAKKCQMCDNQFITRSAKSATWETKCHACFTGYKKVKQVSHSIDMQDNKMLRLISRIEKIESLIDTIPMMVSAEVNNSLGQVTETEMIKIIKEELSSKIEETQLQREDELKAFQAKIQKQILILNNKIINILKEMD